MDRNQLVAAQSTMWCPLYPLHLQSESDRMVAIGVYPTMLAEFLVGVLEIQDTRSVFDILFLWRISSVELKNELILNYQKLKETFL